MLQYLTGPRARGITERGRGCGSGGVQAIEIMLQGGRDDKQGSCIGDPRDGLFDRSRSRDHVLPNKLIPNE